MLPLKKINVKKRTLFIILTLFVAFSMTVSANPTKNYYFESCEVTENKDDGFIKATPLYNISQTPANQYIARTLKDGSIYVDVMPFVETKNETATKNIISKIPKSEYVAVIQDDGSVYMTPVSDDKKNEPIKQDIVAAKESKTEIDEMIETIPPLTAETNAKYNIIQPARVNYFSGGVQYTPSESMTYIANEIAAGKIYAMSGNDLPVNNGIASAIDFKLSEGLYKMQYSANWNWNIRETTVRIGIIPKDGGVFMGSDIIDIFNGNGELTFEIPEDGEYTVIIINASESRVDIPICILQFFWFI